MGQTFVGPPGKWPVPGVQAPVVRKVDNSIHWINLYLVDNAIDFPITYPLDSDLNNRDQMVEWEQETIPTPPPCGVLLLTSYSAVPII